jgi:hypothetical protein
MLEPEGVAHPTTKIGDNLGFEPEGVNPERRADGLSQAISC